MRFFKRKNSQPTAIPEDLQPYYSTQATGWRRWVGPILRAVVLLIVLGLLVWGGIALVRHLTKKNNNAASNQTTSHTKTTTSKPTAPAQKPQATKVVPSPKPTPAPTPSPVAVTPPAAPSPVATPKPTPATPTPAPPTTPASPSAANAAPLVNTGPGDVIALFATVTLIGGLFHRFYLARKMTA